MRDEVHCILVLACRCIRRVAEARRCEASCWGRSSSSAGKASSSLGGVSGSQAKRHDGSTWTRRLCWVSACARSPTEQGGGVGSRAGGGAGAIDVGQTLTAAGSAVRADSKEKSRKMEAMAAAGSWVRGGSCVGRSSRAARRYTVQWMRSAGAARKQAGQQCGHSEGNKNGQRTSRRLAGSSQGSGTGSAPSVARRCRQKRASRQRRGHSPPTLLLGGGFGARRRPAVGTPSSCATRPRLGSNAGCCSRSPSRRRPTASARTERPASARGQVLARPPPWHVARRTRTRLLPASVGPSPAHPANVQAEEQLVTSPCLPPSR